MAAKASCPDNMVLVENKRKGIIVCVDIYETSSPNHDRGISASNQSFFNCQTLCEIQGKRLLSNKEWLESCQGTVAKHCNKFRQSPIERKMVSQYPWFYKKINCKLKGNAWRQ